MSCSLETFRNWGKKAISFLKDYNFEEEPLQDHKPGQYQVRYSKDNIKLIVLGENYGLRASIHFVTPDGEKVPCECLNENQKSPVLTNKPKKEPSQKEQIYSAAQFIKDNLKNVMEGDYSTLIQQGQRRAEEQTKNQEIMKRFLNDPEAQAKRAAIVAASQAGHAFKNKDYEKVIKLLEPHVKYLFPKQCEKLKIAKSQLK